LHTIKNEFHTNTRGAPKSAGPVAVATFATIVNPALLICPHMHKVPLILAIRYIYKWKLKIKTSKELYCNSKRCGNTFPPHYTPGWNVCHDILYE